MGSEMNSDGDVDSNTKKNTSKGNNNNNNNNNNNSNKNPSIVTGRLSSNDLVNRIHADTSSAAVVVAPSDLRPRDVVFGKMASGSFSSRPGNRAFKQFLAAQKPWYAQLSSHAAKKAFLQQHIIQAWEDVQGGRFLLRETSILCTVLVDRATLLRKVHALLRNVPSNSVTAESRLTTTVAATTSAWTPATTALWTPQSVPNPLAVVGEETSSTTSNHDDNDRDKTQSSAAPPIATPSPPPSPLAISALATSHGTNTSTTTTGNKNDNTKDAFPNEAIAASKNE